MQGTRGLGCGCGRGKLIDEELFAAEGSCSLGERAFPAAQDLWNLNTEAVRG